MREKRRKDKTEEGKKWVGKERGRSEASFH